MFGPSKKQRVLAVLDHRIGEWIKVHADKGWGEILSHPQLYVYEELEAVRKQIEKIL